MRFGLPRLVLPSQPAFVWHPNNQILGFSYHGSESTGVKTRTKCSGPTRALMLSTPQPLSLSLWPQCLLSWPGGTQGSPSTDCSLYEPSTLPKFGAHQTSKSLAGEQRTEMPSVLLGAARSLFSPLISTAALGNKSCFKPCCSETEALKNNRFSQALFTGRWTQDLPGSASKPGPSLPWREHGKGHQGPKAAMPRPT